MAFFPRALDAQPGTPCRTPKDNKRQAKDMGRQDPSPRTGCPGPVAQDQGNLPRRAKPTDLY